jgi:thymidylate synthase
MRVVRVRNVAQAWSELPEVLRYDAELQDSRAGRVLVCPEPVATVYTHPCERVLLAPRRDANPFFHLIEALWMLAGRADAATLNHYVRDFGERLAEPHGEIHGAYGYRWRSAMGVDQLGVIVSKLRDNPLDRQAVLQMWQAEEDTCNDLEGSWRDRPCNTHAYFRISSIEGLSIRLPQTTLNSPARAYLDMTVCCRSNDMVFGGYGANAVHFSVLLEYLAARIGVGVGTYTQISNNFHVYADIWGRVKPDGSIAEYAASSPYRLFENLNTASTDHPIVEPMPMFTAPEAIDEDLRRFFEWHDELWACPPGEALTSPGQQFENPWFAHTATRVVLAYWGWRRKMPVNEVKLITALIEAPDWQRACAEWLERRRGARS